MEKLEALFDAWTKAGLAVAKYFSGTAMTESIAAPPTPRKPRAGKKTVEKKEDPLAGLEQPKTEAPKEETDPLAGLETQTPPKKELTDEELKKEMENVARLYHGKVKAKGEDGIAAIRGALKKLFKVEKLSLVVKREDREKLIAWMKAEVEKG